MYKRYENKSQLDKNQKIKLLEEYNQFYENEKRTKGIEKLNVKMPREVFENILDEIGTILIEKANDMSKNGLVKDFLEHNTLPISMSKLLPDDFRTFCLLLNALKQWVSAESAATDRYLLGGTARETCRKVVKKCIITDEALGKDPQLHHPVRDGRPPILISKKGHELIENQQKILNGNDDPIWEEIKSIRKTRNMSWVQLHEGCNAILDNKIKCRPNAKSFARTVIRETGLGAEEILQLLDSKTNT